MMEKLILNQDKSVKNIDVSDESIQKILQDVKREDGTCILNLEKGHKVVSQEELELATQQYIKYMIYSLLGGVSIAALGNVFTLMYDDQSLQEGSRIVADVLGGMFGLTGAGINLYKFMKVRNFINKKCKETLDTK